MPADEFAHLPQDVRPIAALDDEARIAHIRAERWVQHAAADRVLGYMQEALTQPPRERMENLLLIGDSGMGKTMLVRKLERQNLAPFDEVVGVQRRPVVVMLMPHQPTETRFFHQLLVAINAPSASDFVRSYPLQGPAERLLRQLGTRVIDAGAAADCAPALPRRGHYILDHPDGRTLRCLGDRPHPACARTPDSRPRPRGSARLSGRR